MTPGEAKQAVNVTVPSVNPVLILIFYPKLKSSYYHRKGYANLLCVLPSAETR